VPLPFSLASLVLIGAGWYERDTAQMAVGAIILSACLILLIPLLPARLRQRQQDSGGSGPSSRPQPTRVVPDPSGSRLGRGHAPRPRPRSAPGGLTEPSDVTHLN
jgi:hypothetical protein